VKLQHKLFSSASSFSPPCSHRWSTQQKPTSDGRKNSNPKAI